MRKRRPYSLHQEELSIDRGYYVTRATGWRQRRTWRLEGRLLYRDWFEYGIYTRNPFSTRIKTMLDWLAGRTIGGGYVNK
jgi:homoserine trans-succinylase